MKKTLFLMGLALLMSIFACQKDNPDIQGENDPEALPEEEVMFLENQEEAVGFDAASVILPNGETLENYLKRVETWQDSK